MTPAELAALAAAAGEAAPAPDFAALTPIIAFALPKAAFDRVGRAAVVAAWAAA